MSYNSGFVINKALPVPSIPRPTDSFVWTKLKESKSKVGNLVLLSLLIYPFLCGIVLLTFWGDLKYEGLAIPDDFCSLLKDVNGYLLIGFLVLWVTSHTIELLLILAIATDNLRFCRNYLSTVAPPLWTLIILTFGFVMWSGLKPLENNSMTKFIIVFGSSTILVANFFSYHLKTLSEHIRYLSIFTMINEQSALIEYI